MNKILMKFGLYSVVVLVLAFVLLEVAFKDSSYDVQELLGYLSILVALSFVFLGVRNYRDKELNGVISFGKALKIGMLITIFPALAFGLFDLIYSHVIYPDYYTEYYNQIFNDLPNQYSGEELKAKQEEMAGWQEMTKESWYPIFSFLLMSITVLLMGFVVSIITSVALRKKDPGEVAA